MEVAQAWLQLSDAAVAARRRRSFVAWIKLAKQQLYHDVHDAAAQEWLGKDWHKSWHINESGHKRRADLSSVGWPVRVKWRRSQVACALQT